MFLTYKKATVFYLAVVFLLVIDRFLKALAVNNFSFSLIGNFFKFNFAKNFYIAFSLPIYGNWLNLLIGTVIIGLIYYFIFLLKKPAFLETGLVLLVILGAASNLFDRLKFGYVVDYFDLQYSIWRM
jgi:signal peptidase II